MFGNDKNILPRMVDAISPYEQRDLLVFAKGKILAGADPELPSKITAHITKYPENMIVGHIQAGGI